MPRVSPRICLIDDDIYVRDSLALGLRDAGYEAVTAPGAVAGLDIVTHNSVHAIVTDMNMPGTGGAELIAQARATWPDIAIVAITGAAAVDGRNVSDIATERGADAVLIKPFRVAELVALMARLLAD